MSEITASDGGLTGSQSSHGHPLDFDARYRAVASRDERFDGWFYTAVRTTGIYCRPSCPAITPSAGTSSSTTRQPAPSPRVSGVLMPPGCPPGSPEERALRPGRSGHAADHRRVVDREGVAWFGRRARPHPAPRHTVADRRGREPFTAIARANRARTARVLLENTAMSAADIARRRVRQHPAVQRHDPRGVLATPATCGDRTPTPGRSPAPGNPPAVRRRRAAGVPGQRAIPGVESWDGTTFARLDALAPRVGTARIRSAWPTTVRTVQIEDVRDLARP